MKNNYLLRSFLGLLFFAPFSSLSAQCPGTTVNAGEDLFFCEPFQTAQLGGMIDGPFQDYKWTSVTSLSNANILDPTVSVAQTTFFVLSARSHDPAANLIVNPDFEQGNVGFDNDLLYSPGNLALYEVYDVLPNSQSANDAFDPCSDHTSGGGNMLVGNFAGVGSPNLWCQTVPVTPNTDYYYSYWSTLVGGSIIGSLTCFINGAYVTSAHLFPYQDCNWVQKQGIWYSGGNTSATICIRKGKAGSYPAALDDIFFGPACTVRDTVTVFVEKVKASAIPYYTIPCEGVDVTLSGAGSSTGSHFSYHWDTPDGNIVSGQNTLYPVVNAPGTYTLSVSLLNTTGDCTETATVEVEIANTLQAWITAPQTLNCGSNTTLYGHANLQGLTYQWTAGPGGNIVAGTNNSSISVNQPGEYTLLVTNMATGCTAETTVNIGASVSPTINIAPPGTLGAGSDTLTLAATATPANAIFAWTTIGGNIISGANTSNPAINAPGMYILTVTNPLTGCKASDTIQVAKADNCSLMVDAGEDAILCGPFTPYTLNGSIDGPYVKVLWTPSSAVSDPESLQPSINIAQTTTFILKARSDELGENLIVNPDFEQGNFGFSSDLEYSPGNLEFPDSYDVLTNPQTANDLFEACGDHTSGSGNMLATNLIFNIAPLDMWCQTVPVIPNTDYFFSFWATKFRTDALTGVTPDINGQSFPTLTLPGGLPGCEWYQGTGIWNSGNNTTATLCFRRTKSPAGVALDDIFFAPFCTMSDTVTVVVENIKAVANPDFHTIPCEGFELSLNGAGSSIGPNFTYQWDTPDGNIVSDNNTLNPVVNNSGHYTLTVSVENGIGNCSKTAEVEVTSSNQPQVSITAPPSLSCSGNTSLSGSSSQPASSTYQWTASLGGNIVSGQNGQVVIVNQPGAYTLFVTDILTGCTAEETVTIGAPVLPVANASADAITCAQSQTTLSGTGSSVGSNFTYAWSTSNGNIVSGQNNLNAIADTVGVYVLLVTNTANNCKKTDTVTVISNNAALPVNIQPADTITCSQSSITLTTDSATAGSNLIYFWTAYLGGNIVTGADSLAPVVNAPGLYILQVTDTLNACAGVDSITVVADNTAVIAIANAPDVITCASPSVTLNADGSSNIPSLIYSWSTSDGNIISGADSPTPIVNAAGTYHLLLTNPDNGCTATDLAEVTADLAAPDVSLSVSGTLNCNNASVNLINTSATDPDLLDHAWTNPDGSTVNTGSNPILNTNQAGNYTLLVSNTQNGCTNTAEMAVVKHDDVLATLAAQQNATCFGAANGSLGISASGGDGVYTYLWSNDETTPAIGNLAAGTYTVTITDGENCSATLTATVIQPNELLANASATPISVIGASDGTATANPQGGISPYTFIWSNDETTPVIVGLPAGFYTVTVADANGCTAVQTVQVWDGECSLLADFQITDPLCNGSANGEATVLPSGGSAPFTYIWTSGSTEQTATGLAAGAYSVTVTDANDCPFTGEITLANPPLLTLEITGVVATDCPASPEGSATVFATGGTGSVAISWDNGQNGPTATNLTAGDYVAVATDANGCTTSVAATIQAIDQEAPSIQVNQTEVSLGPTGSVTLTPQMLDVLAIDNCKVADVQISPQEFDCFDLGEQQITISAQDDSGNSTTQNVTITFVDLEVPTVECPAGITRCSDENVVLYAAPIAIDNCLVLGGTFTLVEGLPSGSSYPEGATKHIYTYTDMSGNMGTCSFDVIILSPIAVKLDTVIHDINNQNIGGIQVSIGGGLPGYTYEWTKNGQIFASTEDLNGIGTGVYTLLVTDAFGCKTETVSYEVSNIVSTENPGLAERIAVFPNPSSGLVYLIVPEELLDSEIYLTAFDGTGRKVLEQQTGKQKQISLDLSQFADGLYSILVRVGQEQAVWKIVVAR